MSEKHLQAFVNAHRGSRFDWLHNNCLTFATAGLSVFLGRDPWPEDRARLRGMNKAQMFAWWKEIGTLADILDRQFAGIGGRVDVPRTGDIVTHTIDGKDACGIVLGRVAWRMTSDGLQFAPCHAATAAWRIDRG